MISEQGEETMTQPPFTPPLPPLPPQEAKLYSVPRRFDLATIIVVTIAYALLFATLRLMRCQPIAFVVVAGFITCVGIGQALFFGGKRPRISSVLVGVVCLVGTCMVFALFRGWPRFDVRTAALALRSAIAGAFSGYTAGVIVGSVFLISDVMRKSIHLLKRR